MDWRAFEHDLRRQPVDIGVDRSLRSSHGRLAVDRVFEVLDKRGLPVFDMLDRKVRRAQIFNVETSADVGGPVAEHHTPSSLWILERLALHDKLPLAAFTLIVYKGFVHDREIDILIFVRNVHSR